MSPRIILAALLSVQCAPPHGDVEVRVLVPNSSEGRSCKLECMRLENDCMGSRSPVIVESGSRQPTTDSEIARGQCFGQKQECLRTCPGSQIRCFDWSVRGEVRCPDSVYQ